MPNDGDAQFFAESDRRSANIGSSSDRRRLDLHISNHNRATNFFRFGCELGCFH